MGRHWDLKQVGRVCVCAHITPYSVLSLEKKDNWCGDEARQGILFKIFERQAWNGHNKRNVQMQKRYKFIHYIKLAVVQPLCAWEKWETAKMSLGKSRRCETITVLRPLAPLLVTFTHTYTHGNTHRGIQSPEGYNSYLRGQKYKSWDIDVIFLP